MTKFYKKGMQHVVVGGSHICKDLLEGEGDKIDDGINFIIFQRSDIQGKEADEKNVNKEQSSCKNKNSGIFEKSILFHFLLFSHNFFCAGKKTFNDFFRCQFIFRGKTQKTHPVTFF